eukprot:CAMPEP_0184490244 /NCGR_PEP_ID=MMETSP0113_2-20130426/17368_1 /TAXON_ID=91329 /ORGANISM="Norrisiella sphaerica, Strain BC52" /LENGTH=446 /DNA_ID=CAMNT_0026874031 /DNA_START=347 /DNA_END=1687 /DNA_ORIENTATION=-
MIIALGEGMSERLSEKRSSQTSFMEWVAISLMSNEGTVLSGLVAAWVFIIECWVAVVLVTNEAVLSYWFGIAYCAPILGTSLIACWLLSEALQMVEIAIESRKIEHRGETKRRIVTPCLIVVRTKILRLRAVIFVTSLLVSGICVAFVVMITCKQGLERDKFSDIYNDLRHGSCGSCAIFRIIIDLTVIPFICIWIYYSWVPPMWWSGADDDSEKLPVPASANHLSNDVSKAVKAISGSDGSDEKKTAARGSKLEEGKSEFRLETPGKIKDICLRDGIAPENDLNIVTNQSTDLQSNSYRNLRNENKKVRTENDTLHHPISIKTIDFKGHTRTCSNETLGSRLQRASSTENVNPAIRDDQTAIGTLNLPDFDFRDRRSTVMSHASAVTARTGSTLNSNVNLLARRISMTSQEGEEQTNGGCEAEASLRSMRISMSACPETKTTVEH